MWIRGECGIIKNHLRSLRTKTEKGPRTRLTGEGARANRKPSEKGTGGKTMRRSYYRYSRRRKWPRIALLVLLAAAIICGGIFLVRRLAAPDEPAAEPVSYFDFSAYRTTEGPLILVNAAHPLAQDYVGAGQMVVIPQNDPAKRFVLRDGPAQFLDVCYNALDRMYAAAAKAGLKDYVVTSSYRSIEEQTELFNRRVAEYLAQGYSEENAEKEVLKSAAKPGNSEHHTGYSVDMSVMEDGRQIGFEGTSAQLWVGDNCYDYGFIWRYPPNKTEITGVMNEPWHFRYVGLPHSVLMRDKGMVLEEYIGFLQEERELRVAADGNFYRVYYVPLAESQFFELPLAEGESAEVSGDNAGGFIITVREAKQAGSKDAEDAG